MSELITIVKGQQEKRSDRQNRNNNNNRNGGNDRKGANGNKDGRNQRGPDPNASGPFRNELLHYNATSIRDGITNVQYVLPI